MSIPKLLEEIYRKAWGKAWPRINFTIERNQILPETVNNDEAMEIDNANAEGDEDLFEPIPEQASFTCLCDVDLLQRLFNIPAPRISNILILEEYDFLIKVLEKSDRHFIVTGNPGTGKTIFLLHLLLYRLELRLPTAVQFSDKEYFTFNADGASVCRIGDSSIDDMEMLPDGCWCLSDGNAVVMVPFEPFYRLGLRSFLITSARPEPYKKWRTQVGAHTVITALPRTVEVAAIAYMNRLDPRGAVSLVREWGPCTRTVLNILNYPEEAQIQERYASGAAIDIYNASKSRDIGQLRSGRGSTLLFIYPIRRKVNLDYGESMLAIPTMHLSEIFDSKCASLSATDRMKLFEVLSMHSITRGPAGWQHEKNMHMEMLTDGKRFEIFNGDNKSNIESASGLVGTASALRDAVRNGFLSFYWFPSVVNFPGIDGVLVIGKDIYALQATIADAQQRPDAGLKKAWEVIGAVSAQLYNWHFVMVTDKQTLAEKYMKELGTHLHGVQLGSTHLGVSVWGCVLENRFGPLGGKSGLSGLGK